MTTRPATSPGVRRPGGPLVWLVTAIGVIASITVAVAQIRSSPGVDLVTAAGSLSLLGSVTAFLLSGALIASRQPANIIGWLLMMPGVGMPAGLLASMALESIDPAPTEASLGLWILVWFTSWFWMLLIFPIFHLLLVFPTGRLLSPRWRAAVALEGGMIATFLLLAAFAARLTLLQEDVAVWSVPNPVGFIGPEVFDAVFGGPWDACLLAITTLSVSAVILRFWHGSPVTRQQLKWPLLAITFFGVVYGVGAVQSGASADSIWNVLFGVAIACIPVSVAVAVLRYRLFEIDRIISRTLGWAVVTGVLVAVFAGLVVGLQALLVGFTGGQTLAVAASTLIAFALFQPVRRRVQHAVDRRFDRARYDASFTADEFAARLRDEVDIDAVVDDFGGTVGGAMRPTALGIWIREPGR